MKPELSAPAALRLPTFGLRQAHVHFLDRVVATRKYAGEQATTKATR